MTELEKLVLWGTAIVAVFLPLWPRGRLPICRVLPEVPGDLHRHSVGVGRMALFMSDWNTKEK